MERKWRKSVQMISFIHQMIGYLWGSAARYVVGLSYSTVLV